MYSRKYRAKPIAFKLSKADANERQKVVMHGSPTRYYVRRALPSETCAHASVYVIEYRDELTNDYRAASDARYSSADRALHGVLTNHLKAMYEKVVG